MSWQGSSPEARLARVKVPQRILQAVRDSGLMLPFGWELIVAATIEAIGKGTARRVLELRQQGLRTAEIARRLDLSITAVSRHLRALGYPSDTRGRATMVERPCFLCGEPVIRPRSRMRKGRVAHRACQTKYSLSLARQAKAKWDWGLVWQAKEKGLKAKEISAVMGIPRPTVYSILQRRRRG